MSSTNINEVVKAALDFRGRYVLEQMLDKGLRPQEIIENPSVSKCHNYGIHAISTIEIIYGKALQTFCSYVVLFIDPEFEMPIIPTTGVTNGYQILQEAIIAYNDPFYSALVFDMGLQAQTRNTLISHGIYKLRDILQLGEHGLLDKKGIGVGAISDIKQVLSSLNVTLPI